MSRARYSALVTRIDDPEQRGRIRVRCDSILSNGQEIEEWIPPVFPVGGASSMMLLLPDVGEEVTLTAVADDDDSDSPGEGFIVNPDFYWEGAPLPQDVTLPSVLTGSYGNRVGFYFTSSGGETYCVFDRAASQAMLVASQVKLGVEGASHPVTLADLLRPILVALFQSIQTQFNAHVHPIGTPSTGTPGVPMTLSLTDLQGTTWQSAKVKASGSSE